MFLTDKYKIEIRTSKLTDYLLNLSHPDGWSKAKYFKERDIISLNDLESILTEIISMNDVSKTIETWFGLKFIVDGKIESKNIYLRTVWVVLKGENTCKFVTAYPL